MSQTVTLSFYRFDSWRARIWAFAMMGLARPAMRRVPALQFWKLCGAGSGVGFDPLPDTRVYAILAAWPDDRAARDGLDAKVFRRYRAAARETWTVFLTPTSARGAWSGQRPFTVTDGPDGAACASPLAALTRATIRPRILLRFWRRVPDISAAIGADPNVAFRIGIGEVPWLHQVTFSIWPDARSLSAFARTGSHAAAIRAVRRDGWFREELFARFNVRAATGTWNGKAPLAALEMS